MEALSKLYSKAFIFIISSGIYNEVGRKEFERCGRYGSKKKRNKIKKNL